MEQTLLFKGTVALGRGFVAVPVIQVFERVLGDSRGEGLLGTVIWLADGMESLVESYPVVLLTGTLRPGPEALIVIRRVNEGSVTLMVVTVAPPLIRLLVRSGEEPHVLGAGFCGPELKVLLCPGVETDEMEVGLRCCEDCGRELSHILLPGFDVVLSNCELVLSVLQGVFSES